MLRPDLAELLQKHRLVELVAHELVEHQAFDPAHLQDREPLAADADALHQILELDGERQPRRLEMAADFAVALALAGDVAREALDRPLALGRRGVELIDVGEVAGPRHRHAEGVEHRLAARSSGSLKLLAGSWIASL